MSAPAAPAPLSARVARSLGARLRGLRASPALSGAALSAAWRARRGGHPAAADHAPHRDAALDWLCRAQDARGDDGIARGYALAWSPYFRAAGWQPSYPETTGYIIPTLLSAARLLCRPDLRERALRAARWETAVQLPSGAVRGGVMGEPASPAVFNTGQVILGWLAAWREAGDEQLALSARRAGRFLTAAEEEGRFLRGNSRFARPDATAYNARAAWALAEVGRALDEPGMTAAAARVLRATAATAHRDGWFPGCCLYDPARPLLHTLAYTIRGLLEGGRVLQDEGLLAAARVSAAALASRVDAAGWLPGRFAAGWRGAARWSCLTGQAQMANVWLRLAELDGDDAWREPARRVLRFLKTTQDRTTPEGGVRGGILGSWPAGGEYGRYEVLSWATKFTADALLRDEHPAAADGGGGVSALA